MNHTKTFAFVFHHGASGETLLYHHNLTNNGDDHNATIRLFHGQSHLGAFLTANQLNRIIQFHIHHIYGFCRPLRHLQNQISRFQLPLAITRAAWHNPFHLYISIALRQCSTNTLQFTGHADIEVLFVLWWKIVCVGVIDLSNGVRIHANLVFAIHFFQSLEPIYIEFFGLISSL